MRLARFLFLVPPSGFCVKVTLIEYRMYAFSASRNSMTRIRFTHLGGLPEGWGMAPSLKFMLCNHEEPSSIHSMHTCAHMCVCAHTHTKAMYRRECLRSRGGGGVQVGGSLVLEGQTVYSNRQLEAPALGGSRARRIPDTCWPATLAFLMSPT